jgi:DNA topoisomerase-1
VSETDNGLAFDFVGKSAKEHHVELQDERLIEIVQACSDLPGYQVFKYLDEHGHKQVVDSSDINEYLRTHICTNESRGEMYSAKDFRTWMASVLAASHLYDELQTSAGKAILASAPNSAERQQLITDMVKSVAEALGNTPAVCRASYINPRVIERFLAGQFFEPYKQARRGHTNQYQNCEEQALLGFLRADV